MENKWRRNEITDLISDKEKNVKERKEERYMRAEFKIS